MSFKERVKAHYENNKKFYAGLGVGLAFAGITALIMRGRHAENSLGSDGPSRVTVRPFAFLSDQDNVVNVVQRTGRGHPGYIIRNIETNEIFSSQSQAAKSYGISEKIISKQLSGEFESAKGLHFERVNLGVE